MREVVERVVLEALTLANRSRPADLQLAVGPEAAIYGPDSQLDSLGLVALILDVEDGLQSEGHAVSLADAAALSRRNSPFRSVPALVTYIEERIARAG